MILRRYGSSMQSVEMDFDAKALNEIGFRRDHQFSLPAEEFEAGYREVEVREFAPRDEGWVQNETEQSLLDHLEKQVREMESELGEDEVLLVLNEQGVDYPKAKHSSKTASRDGETRLFFTSWVEPALRLGRYARG